MVLAGGQEFLHMTRPRLIFMEVHKGFWNKRSAEHGWKSSPDTCQMFWDLGYRVWELPALAKNPNALPLFRNDKSEALARGTFDFVLRCCYE